MVKRINEGPIYVVKPESCNGPQCTLHRDLPFPCGFLTIDAAPEEETETKVSRRKDLRSRKPPDQEMDQSDQEDDMSDEEQGYCSERVIEVTTKPPLVQLAGDEPIRRPLAALDPQAVELIPRILPEEVQSDLPVKVPASVIEIKGSADPATSPDHVIIDIPEPDMPTLASQSEKQTQESTEQAQDQYVSPESGQSHDVQPTHADLSESEPDEPRCCTRETSAPQIDL